MVVIVLVIVVDRSSRRFYISGVSFFDNFPFRFAFIYFVLFF